LAHFAFVYISESVYVWIRKYAHFYADSRSVATKWLQMAIQQSQADGCKDGFTMVDMIQTVALSAFCKA
jgi:hypothetical protein